MAHPLNIWLLEPYAAGSHRAWAEGYTAHSRHQVTPFTLPGRFWKWRMHGGAVTLSKQALQHTQRPDAILATDMLDVPTFLGLTRAQCGDVPVALYCHENQLTYPLVPGEKRDLHYAYVNFASALVARRVFFNSQYHLDSFFDELPRLLKHFPDYNELEEIQNIRQRAAVLPLGLDLQRLDLHRPATPRAGRPTILWNHRWEYDKDPATFFAAVNRLAEEGWDFGLILLGENFRQEPWEFLEARGRWLDRIVHFGFAEAPADYARLLWQADLAVSTAQHDFFGAAVVEAMYCDCVPVLPHRLAYPELIPPAWQAHVFYSSFDELLAMLRQRLQDIAATRQLSLREAVSRYDWSVMAPRYDAAMEELVSLS